MPEGGAPIWRLYHRLRRRKGSNGFSANPIEWKDIAAFSDVTGIRLLDWEVGVIEDIDDAFMEQQAKAARADAEKQKRQDKKKGR